jgi:uncharacterized integral membrane protein
MQQSNDGFISSVSGFFKFCWRNKIALLSLVVAIFLIIIILQNWDEVDIDVLFWHYDRIPLLIVILGAFLVGVVIASPIVFLLTRKRYLKRSAPAPSPKPVAQQSNDVESKPQEVEAEKKE